MQYFGLKYCISVLIVLNIINFTASEPFTISIVGAALLAVWYNWDTVADNTVCHVTECCNSNYIPYDIDKLSRTLAQKLFGQPLVHRHLVNIFRAHKKVIFDKNKQNQKALVLSFHGSTGVGKNYASTMIAEALYTEGMGSEYVKLFMGSKDFDCKDVEKSKKKLIATIANIVRKCSNSLIIFDEIDRMCSSVLDAIVPMIDHHQAVDGIDYRNSIFIFLSNTGAKRIAEHLKNHIDANGKRGDMKLYSFEDFIRKISYTVAGGFKSAALLEHHLIDHYIPFLPLEQVHVEECAEDEFRRNGVIPTEEMMEEALSVIEYGPEKIFAETGCKRFNKQVPFVIEKYHEDTE